MYMQTTYICTVVVSVYSNVYTWYYNIYSYNGIRLGLGQS